MGRAIFITGTGTDVGKTFVTALVVKKLKELGASRYYKAALSGADVAPDGSLLPGDALYVRRIAGLLQGECVVSYIYREAVSPHLAAQHEGHPLEVEVVNRDFQALKALSDYVTMEGSGGIICPLRWDAERRIMLDDIVCALRLPALIVADAGLGTLNACALTAGHLRARGIRAKGFLFNRYEVGNPLHEDNREMAQRLTGLPVLAVIAKGAEELSMEPSALAALYE